MKDLIFYLVIPYTNSKKSYNVFICDLMTKYF